MDALVGRQTRAHQDLDLAVNANDLPRVLNLLGSLGFAVVVDWLPVRAQLEHSDGRRVDLHPVRFAADGSGVQAGLDGAVFSYAADGFSSGNIDGHSIRCLSARQQLSFREGYPWCDVDRHDVALLRKQLRQPGHEAWPTCIRGRPSAFWPDAVRIVSERLHRK